MDRQEPSPPRPPHACIGGHKRLRAAVQAACARHVSTLFKKNLGKTFSDVLQEQRMERAALMLRGTSLTIDEIAYQLGYSTKSGFYKVFKEHFGTTPRTWA